MRCRFLFYHCAVFRNAGFALLFLAASASAFQTRAHCADTPVVVLEKPAPDISVQETCYYGNVCLTDTFYQAELEEELYRLYDSLPGAAFVNIDSVDIWWQKDSIVFSNGYVLVDSFQYEKVWMSAISPLKGNFPDTILWFQEKWLFLPESPEMTYASLIDTPLVVFFDSITTLSKLGVRPVDGCYFEATAFAVMPQGIQKMGIERIPGIYVPTEEFLVTIGRGDVKDPSLKASKKNRIVLDWRNSRLTLQGYKPIKAIKLMNLQGQILYDAVLNNPAPLFLPDLSTGIYLAQVTGEDWNWQGKICLQNLTQNRVWTINMEL